MNHYLIIAELETTGYIIGIADDYTSAEIEVDVLVSLGDKYNTKEHEELIQYLQNHQSYPINPNAEYFTNYQVCHSDGIFSVYIIDLTKQEFSLQQFISERNNTSYAIVDADNDDLEMCFYAN